MLDDSVCIDLDALTLLPLSLLLSCGVTTSSVSLTFSLILYTLEIDNSYSITHLYSAKMPSISSRLTKEHVKWDIMVIGHAFSLPFNTRTDTEIVKHAIDIYEAWLKPINSAPFPAFTSSEFTHLLSYISESL